MRKGALLVFSVFARFSLDSARTRIPTVKMAASQKNNRAALDIFILFGPFSMRQHWGFRCVETQLTLYGSVREICAGGCKQRKQNLSTYR
jgi:hypothetical protein